MTFPRISKAIAGVFVALSFSSPSAFACDLTDGGFLAAAIICVVPEAAPLVKIPDELNGRHGRLFEGILAQGANTIVPGSGPLLRRAWNVGEINNDSAGAAPQPFPQSMPVPSTMPMPPTGNLPQLPHMPQTQQPSTQSMGNYCHTPQGRFGPYQQYIPVGMPCYSMPYPGYVLHGVAGN